MQEAPLIEPFIERLHYNLKRQNIYAPIPPINNTIDLDFLLNRSISLIQNVVWNCLPRYTDPIGLDLLHDIYENTEYLDIATLNHDLLVENFLDSKQIEYCGGFGKQEGDVRYFQSELYDKGNKTNLFKLHGSINWYRFRSTKDGNTIDKYGMAVGRDHWHLKDENGHFVTNLDGYPLFLTGSNNKMLDYNFGIYRILHAKFDRSLKRKRIMVMSGYGWNDRGINGRLFEWLGSSINNRLILLHENPDDLKKYSRSALWHRYDDLISDGRLIPITKWFLEVKFSDIEEYF